MPQKDEILNSLNELASEVAHARESLLKGEAIKINSVHDRIETQCQLIVDLDPEEAEEIRPTLDGLLDNLRVFSAEIEYVQAKVAEILEKAREAEIDDKNTDNES